jgi:hypothetical protein
MENVGKVLWFTEGQSEGEASLDELSAAPGISRYHFGGDATIRARWKRIFEPIGEMLAVERLRQLDDGERANIGAPGNVIEVYSPILRWLRGRV